VLLGSLGEVDLSTSGAASLDDVVKVDLLHAVFVYTRWLA
jgi:hypothetical protein